MYKKLHILTCNLSLPCAFGSSIQAHCNTKVLHTSQFDMENRDFYFLKVKYDRFAIQLQMYFNAPRR